MVYLYTVPIFKKVNMEIEGHQTLPAKVRSFIILPNPITIKTADRDARTFRHTALLGRLGR